MSEKVRVGIIGTSWYADMMHYPALKSHSQAELVSICGRNQERAREMAVKYGAQDTYSDYQQMFQKSNLDAVIISSPDDMHYEMTMAAIDQGVHVLCEKPLALAAPQAWEMYQNAQKKEVKHMTYFTYRWMPFFQYARDLIKEDYIGHCYHCEFRMLMGFGRSQQYRWRFDKNRCNGVLGDLGSHMIDMARWLIGEITSVSANLAVSVKRSGIGGVPINPANDSALLLIRFANGAHGTIVVSNVAHVADRGGYQQIRLYGESGTIKINSIYSGSEAQRVIQGARDQDEQFQNMKIPDKYWGDADPSDVKEIFTNNSVGTRLFIDAILGGCPIEPNFYEGFKAQQVVDAALESHETGCALRIDNSV